MKDKQTEERIPFSEENLLKVILQRKQTMQTLIDKFGYQEKLHPTLKKLIDKGEIKQVECYINGLRLVFVKPNYDETNLKVKTHKFFTQKVQKYLKKKEKEMKKKQEVQGEEEH